MIFPFILGALTLIACEMRLQIPPSTNAPDIPAYEFEATGEDFLISALDEIQNIADWSEATQKDLNLRLLGNTSVRKETLLSITSTDTVYIFGVVLPGGYGAVVTERYARLKGMLLITDRRTYGNGDGHIVTETKRYASYADHKSDNPQQTNVTEVYGLQADTLVTRVLRNGTLQTYTFRLPVVTRVISPQDGSIRVTSRYASGGEIISRVTDGDGNLVQLSRTFGLSDGSSVVRTEYPDGSWRQVRTHGEADGTVTRETTSGLPTLGSGNTAFPTTVPRPVMSMWTSPRSGSDLHDTNEGETIQNTPFFASGTMLPVGRAPRPLFTSLDATAFRSIPSNLFVPDNFRPATPGTQCPSSSYDVRSVFVRGTRFTTLASGNACILKPIRPSLASGATPNCPRPPLPVSVWSVYKLTDGRYPPASIGLTVSGKHSLCSGISTVTPRPPQPVMA